ncbi:hypothetical protein [Nocardia wallacei]|uniref:hypothetical protein n=1 Tax=Nocardia wallacei TaxID=480035 RepID=UPI0024557F7F|nr:hypothetical protein [Nocardia wallacei]
MADASIEVLLDDFENKGRWGLGGDGASRTHLTTFAEGAPTKRPGVYADGAAGADHRALVLLIRAATDGLEVDLVAKQGEGFAIPGRIEALNLWVRSPHASIEIAADLGGSARNLLLGTVSADAEWQRVQGRLDASLADTTLLGLQIRLTEVIKREGEVMILLDDLTAHTEH